MENPAEVTVVLDIATNLVVRALATIFSCLGFAISFKGVYTIRLGYISCAGEG